MSRYQQLKRRRELALVITLLISFVVMMFAGNMYYENKTAPKLSPIEVQAEEPVMTSNQMDKVEEKAEPVQTYTVQDGDTLWDIAEELYDDGTQWTELFEANGDIIDNPDLIYPGQVLVIH